MQLYRWFIFGLTLAIGALLLIFYDKYLIDPTKWGSPIIDEAPYFNQENYSGTKISPNDVQIDDLYDKLKHSLHNAREKLTILIWWNTMADRDRYPLYELPYHCGRCEVVTDKSKLNHKTTKAVIFHFQALSLNSFPPTRRLDQYYVWLCYEGPPALYSFRGLQLKEYDRVFNLTMTYRDNSDISVSYGNAGKAYSKVMNLTLPLDDRQLNGILKAKTALALWVASNCDLLKGARERMRYIMEMKKHGLNIEMSGKCFNDKRVAYEFSKYKFYMAFENSWHCRDYITEKFWENAIIHGTVPVVVGPPREDYEKVAPPNSFIFALDFATPRALVDYLNYLDQNDTAYLEYFQWMKMDLKEMPQYRRESEWCQLCRVLHGINIDDIYNPVYSSHLKDIPMFGRSNGTRVVQSLNKRFYQPDDAVCLRP